MSDKAPAFINLVPVYAGSDRTTEAAPVLDPTAARSHLLEAADSTAHAAATAGGADPMWCGVYLTEGLTGYVRIRVPPGVTECDLSILVAGSGSVTVTSGSDSTGSTLTWDTQAAISLTHAGTVETVGVLATSAGAASGRAVTVRSSVAWAWADEVLTIVSSSAGSVDGVIYGIHVTPIQVARPATAGSY
jgi:hypothetical protein